MNLQLAKFAMPKDVWTEMTGKGAELVLTHFLGMIEQQEGLKLNEEKLEKAVVTIRKEVEKLYEEQYEQALEVTQACMKEIYTSEELEILGALWEKYPWLLKKGRLLSVATTEKMLPLAGEISEQLEGSRTLDKTLTDLFDEAFDEKELNDKADDLLDEGLDEEPPD